MQRLHAHPDSLVRRIAQALDEALDGHRTPEEAVWIDRIEALRTRLNTSAEVLTMDDYPASALDDAGREQRPSQTRTVAETCTASVSPSHALLLFKLVRALDPRQALELGTCIGISAAYQAAAQRLGGGGHLVTLEGVSDYAELARRNVLELGLDHVDVVQGWFQDTLAETLEQHQPFQYAYIDGHHQEKATITYFEQVLPYLSEPALLVFDDIAWSEGMKRAWETICAHPRTRVSIDLYMQGICLIDERLGEKQAYQLMLW